LVCAIHRLIIIYVGLREINIIKQISKEEIKGKGSEIRKKGVTQERNRRGKKVTREKKGGIVVRWMEGKDRNGRTGQHIRTTIYRCLLR